MAGSCDNEAEKSTRRLSPGPCQSVLIPTAPSEKAQPRHLHSLSVRSRPKAPEFSDFTRDCPICRNLIPVGSFWGPKPKKFPKGELFWWVEDNIWATSVSLLVATSFKRYPSDWASEMQPKAPQLELKRRINRGTSQEAGITGGNTSLCRRCRCAHSHPRLRMVNCRPLSSLR